MSAMITTELILGVLLGLVIAAVAYIWLRRRYISDGQPLMICAIRTASSPRWRLGLMRLKGDRLEWFSVVGPDPRPEQVFHRHRVDFTGIAPLTDAVPGLGDAIVVTARDPKGEFDLALSPAAYTVIRAWLESAPPGHNVNVV